jgi:molybdenum cofactor synthesis domain-containing protein
MSDVEVFSIGDELLRGIVADTNSNWIAKRVAARGARLTRVTTLGDDPPLVASALRSAFERRPSVIITQGGLGPTDDDRTRDSVADATGLPLERSEDAEAVVRRRYSSLAESGVIETGELDEARDRMSLVPRGAIALDNRVGGAPGLIVPAGDTSIICLPGVPQELWWIWENSLAPHLDRLLGPGGFFEMTVRLDERDESRLARVLRGVTARHPDVYVKSRATAFEERDPRVRLTLAASGSSDAAARSLVDAAFADAERELTTIGVSVEEREISSSIGRNATT